MAKKLRPPLDMGNDIYVRNLEQLKENFNIEKVTEHFLSGKLLTWLNDRHCDEEAEQVQKLAEQCDKDNLAAKLGEIFGINIDDEIDIDSIDIMRQRTDMLRRITSDDHIIEHPELVAFSQEELDKLAKTEETIYLYGEKFNIDLEIENRTYIGLGDKPEINLIGEINWDDFNSDSDSVSLNFDSDTTSFGNIKILNSHFSEVTELKIAMKGFEYISAFEINGDEIENIIVSSVHDAYGFKLLFRQIYK